MTIVRWHDGERGRRGVLHGFTSKPTISYGRAGQDKWVTFAVVTPAQDDPLYPGRDFILVDIEKTEVE